MKIILLSLVFSLVLNATSGTNYILMAPGPWKENSHGEAVKKAGGQVRIVHAPTGIATVTSSNPDFLKKIVPSGKFQVAEEDAVVQWIKDTGKPMLLDEEDREMANVSPHDDKYYYLQWALKAINAEGAWEAGCDGYGARVAVLDGGIFAEHPDIKPNLDIECSTSFIFDDDTGNTIPFDQDVQFFQARSTHIAGTVAAVDNEIGVIGVAPSSTLMHIKVMHEGYAPWSSVIMGIMYAADPQSFGSTCTKHADIITMSLSHVFKKSAKFQDPTDPKNPGLVGAVTKAVNFAASQNVLVISCVSSFSMDLGQNKSYVELPAMAGSGLAVSATGPMDVLNNATNSNFRHFASYSNYGENLVNLAAPGGDIMFCEEDSSSCVFDWVLSTGSPGYWFFWGISAAPHVAGVAALIKGANPDISLGALKTKLLRTADDEGKVGKDKYYGHGFVNAARACME